MKIDEIVAKVATASGMKPGELKKAVDAVFSAIKASVEQGEKVSIAGLGSFVQKSREAGEKVNEKTGQTRPVEAASFIAFKPAKSADGNKKDKTKKDKKVEEPK